MNPKTAKILSLKGLPPRLSPSAEDEKYAKERLKAAKAYYRRKLTPEEQEIKDSAKYYRQLAKEIKDSAKYYRQQAKEEKEREKRRKEACKKELAILNFMLQTDVLYHHHGEKESLKKQIAGEIATIKETGEHQVYHPYIWNYQGEGNNYMPRAQLGYRFGSSDFDTIYDVPLDGSYIFYAYDSGQRGSGVFHYLTVRKVDKDAVVPKVNPGGMPPIYVP